MCIITVGETTDKIFLQRNPIPLPRTRRIVSDCALGGLKLPKTYWEGFLSLPPRLGFATNSYSLLFVFPTTGLMVAFEKFMMDSLYIRYIIPLLRVSCNKKTVVLYVAYNKEVAR